ncbi:MAG: acyl-ACP--UDP-N-acetylglucosamine O-acyltransferase [Planctomycetes bacterium]|nr:acyl-ACP--UDP-N-acetylglucosamine O-acyltransferase [Planctomycetota bacterium]
MIHPRACVHASVVVPADVEVGAFAVIEADVVFGPGCRIAEHAIVRAGSTLGAAVVVDSHATVGGAPQMRGEVPAAGRVRIGHRSVLREGVTINRPTKVDGVTTIGDDCMLMANSHVGHDSTVGDNVTLANNVMLAGHVEIGAGTFVGGGAGVHQFVRIGSGAMVGGNASISYDVPPYAIAAERNLLYGLNVVGLRRSRMPAEDLAALKRCYHQVFCGPGDLRARVRALLQQDCCAMAGPGRRFLEFFVGGKRGFARPRDHRGGQSLTAAACE